MIRHAALLAPVIVAVSLAGCGRDATGSALTSTSPDGRHTVRLREVPTALDRNFVVEVSGAAGGAFAEVFRSPDEGRPAGTERFVWSGDGRWVLLVGERFLVNPRIRMDGGGEAYLLINVETQELWCNAAQSPHRRISAEQLIDLGYKSDE